MQSRPVVECPLCQADVSPRGMFWHALCCRLAEISRRALDCQFGQSRHPIKDCAAADKFLRSECDGDAARAARLAAPVRFTKPDPSSAISIELFIAVGMDVPLFHLYNLCTFLLIEGMKSQQQLNSVRENIFDRDSVLNDRNCIGMLFRRSPAHVWVILETALSESRLSEISLRSPLGKVFLTELLPQEVLNATSFATTGSITIVEAQQRFLEAIFASPKLLVGRIAMAAGITLLGIIQQPSGAPVSDIVDYALAAAIANGAGDATRSNYLFVVIIGLELEQKLLRKLTDAAERQTLKAHIAARRWCGEPLSRRALCLAALDAEEVTQTTLAHLQLLGDTLAAGEKILLPKLFEDRRMSKADLLQQSERLQQQAFTRTSMAIAF